MSTIARAPDAPDPGRVAPAPGPAGVTADTATDPARSTPSFLRRWNVTLLILVGSFAVVASVSSLVMRSASATTADSTAPALVGIQDVFSSVAEANTAATAAFLSADASGTEDRINRNLYLDAIRRAVGQAEEVSATIGDDAAAHQALADLGVGLNTYSGRIEASRVEILNQLPEADEDLRRALDLVNGDIAQSVATVTAQGQEQLDEERTTGRWLTWAAVALGVVTLGALIRVQWGLLQRTNRILNPLLVVATALIATVVGYLVVGPTARAEALDRASDGGYDAVATTSAIQAAAFDLQSRLSLQILDNRGESLEPSYGEVEARIAELLAGVDSERERAAAETLTVRWERYQAVARQIEGEVDRGRQDEAVARFQGDGLSTFNGLNTALESALSDNREQFLDGVDQASGAVGLTPLVSIVLPVLAALISLLAIQNRLGEYR